MSIIRMGRGKDKGKAREKQGIPLRIRLVIGERKGKMSKKRIIVNYLLSALALVLAIIALAK